MIDGKKVLEEFVVGIGCCEYDGGFDCEIGFIGCMFGDKCVCVYIVLCICVIVVYVVIFEV